MPTPNFSSNQYAIVIDAGSSGSRLQIYSWKDPEAERRQVISDVKRRRRGQGKGKGREAETEEQEVERSLKRLVKVGKGAGGDDWVKRAEPGISTIQPSQISSYLSPLLTHALQQIPPSQHSRTPIYLLATAGMRLLPLDEQTALLSAVCSTLRSDYPFVLDAPGVGEGEECGESVRVISGEEEGMWGWVAVNYLMDGFGHPPKETPELSPLSSSTNEDGQTSHLLPLDPLITESSSSHSSTSSPTLVDPTHRSPTFGFLDMGGASTQLAYSPTLAELSHSAYPPELLRSVKLRLLTGETVEWPVFVASWLGFGTNRVRGRYEDMKIEEWRSQIALQSSLLDAPTPLPSDLVQPILDPCLPKSLTLTSHIPNTPSFLGTGSFSSCLSALSPLLSTNTPCPPPHTHCLFAGLPTPHIDFERDDQRGFIGISEYWYTADQVLGLGGVWDWGEWEKGMEGFCERDWEELTSGEMGKVERGRLEMQCFKGAWISDVLHEGIGIPRLGLEKGGDDTLMAEEDGDLNEEAERRAKEKGLISKSSKKGKGKSHFQSLDSIGETAVSWTLGKMVIEASKAIQLHGHTPSTPGISSKWWAGAPGLPFAWDESKDRLEEMIGLDHVRLAGEGYGVGREAVWAYWFFVGGLVGVLWWTARGRRGQGKRRKPSDAGGLYGMMEAGGGSQAGQRGKPFMGGTFRAWTYKVTEMAKRVSSTGGRGLAVVGIGGGSAVGGRPTPSRHQSMPVGMRLSDLPKDSTYSSASSISSQPSSPGGAGNHFFTPAYGSSSPPSSARKTMSTQDLSSSGTSTTPTSSTLSMRAGPSSSLRGSARSKSRQTNLAPLTPDGLPSATSGGWNDPPFLTSPYGRSEDDDTPRTGSVLITPSERSGQVLSRQSSRVNLNELGVGGLNSRPVSRGTTPTYMDDPGGF